MSFLSRGSSSSTRINRNLVINGQFQVNRRPSPYNNYVVERWISNAGNGLRTASAITINPPYSGDPDSSFPDFTPAFYRHSQIQASTSQSCFIEHRIEDLNYFLSRTFTLSFWHRCPVASSPVSFQIFRRLNLGLSEFIGQASPVVTPSTSIFQFFSLTFTVPRLSISQAVTSGSFFGFIIDLGTDKTFEFEIANVKLEEGAIATPYVGESIAETIAKCNRYYRRYEAKSLGLANFPTHSNGNTIEFGTPMRIAPTMLGGSFSVNAGSRGTAVAVTTTEDALLTNSDANWTLNAIVSFDGQFDAEL